MSTGKLLGKPNKLPGNDMRWTSIPSTKSRNTLSRFILQKPGISSGSYGPVGSKALWFIYFFNTYLLQTEFEVQTVSYRPRYFRLDNKSERKKRWSVTYSTDRENEVSKIFITSLGSKRWGRFQSGGTAIDDNWWQREDDLLVSTKSNLSRQISNS